MNDTRSPATLIKHKDLTMISTAALHLYAIRQALRAESQRQVRHWATSIGWQHCFGVARPFCRNQLRCDTVTDQWYKHISRVWQCFGCVWLHRIVRPVMLISRTQPLICLRLHVCPWQHLTLLLFIVCAKR